MTTVMRSASPGDGARHDAVHESDATYRAIFDLANDAIFLHDASTGAIVDVNRKMTEMYGYTREQALHLTVADLSAGRSPFTQDRALEFLQAASAGTPQLFDWWARDRAGRTFWVEVNLKRAPINGSDRLLAIVRDITDRKRAEHEIRVSHESQKTLNALLRLALAETGLDELLHRALALVLQSSWLVTRGVGGVYLADESGSLALRADIGLDSSRRADVPILHRGACACGPEYHCIAIAAGDKPLGILKIYLDPDHPLQPVEEEFLAAFASTLAGIIVRKRAEQGLQAADEQLREQAALVRLGEMAAVVAHEVKNPLAGVRGAIQVLGGHMPPHSTDAAVVGQIVARLDALDELMTDLLLFARPPQVHVLPVDIAALARETSDLVAQESGTHDIRFEVDGTAPLVMADPKLLKSVLLNLQLNAAHALQNSGIIRTSVVATDSMCVVTVADTGPGIPLEIRDRIFVPFFTTKARGTGLGLPTAKRLVEAHRGRINVDCPPGGGTVVTIELPQA